MITTTTFRIDIKYGEDGGWEKTMWANGRDDEARARSALISAREINANSPNQVSFRLVKVEITETVLA
jgi:hypothetical protein